MSPSVFKIISVNILNFSCVTSFVIRSAGLSMPGICLKVTAPLSAARFADENSLRFALARFARGVCAREIFVRHVAREHTRRIAWEFTRGVRIHTVAARSGCARKFVLARKHAPRVELRAGISQETAIDSTRNKNMLLVKTMCQT